MSAYNEFMGVWGKSGNSRRELEKWHTGESLTKIQDVKGANR